MRSEVQGAVSSSVSSSVSETGNEAYMLLDTSQILEPEATNVRPYSVRQGDTEEEIKAITALAATIEEEGQIQPVRVRRVEGNQIDAAADMYEMIAGRRRKKAVELINAGRKAGEELMLKAVVVSDVSDPSAFRQACIENLHRKDMSPMNMYENIQTVRENFGWQGKSGTKKVAEFFKVSPATVTQYELLGKLPEALKVQVHSGGLSRDDAFRLAVIAAKKGEEAALEAARVGEEAAGLVDAGSGAGSGEAGSETDAGAGADSEHRHETPDEKKARTKKAKAAKSKAIKEAAREADPDKLVPRSKKDLMEFFTSCYGPAYGYADGAVHKFVDALERFAAGGLSDRALYKYWDACVEGADKGTPESNESVPNKVPGKVQAAGKLGKGKVQGKVQGKAVSKPGSKPKSQAKSKSKSK